MPSGDEMLRGAPSPVLLRMMVSVLLQVPLTARKQQRRCIADVVRCVVLCCSEAAACCWLLA